MLGQPTPAGSPDCTLTTAPAAALTEVVSLNAQIQVRKAADQHTVLLQQQPIMVYAPADRATMKAVAVQLVQTGQATVAEVSQGLALPASTLRDAVQAFRTTGIGGLVPARRGPRGPWKFTAARRQQALATAWADPTVSWAEITANANAGAAQPVSRRHVQRCLAAELAGRAARPAAPPAAPCAVGVQIKHSLAPLVAPTVAEPAASLPAAVSDPAAPATALVAPVSAPASAALVTPVSAAPAAPAASLTVPISAPAAAPAASLPASVSNPAPAPAVPLTTPGTPAALARPVVAPAPTLNGGAAVAPAPAAGPDLTPAERRYLARLRQGVDSAFGGGLLTLPSLHELDLVGLVARTFTALTDQGYTVCQMVLACFFLALFNLPSLEATRTLLHSEFGVLLGRRRGPGLDKLRRFLQAVQVTQRSEAFMLAVAQRLLTMGVVDWQVLYLDGHFIPYFGQHVIRQGYFTVRRLAMPGHQAYYANDARGRPFFFLLTAASDHLTATMPTLLAQVKSLVGARWVDWGLTMCFDRGGFSAALFKELDERKVYWLTWFETGQTLRQVIAHLPEEGFQLSLIRLQRSKVLVKLSELGVYVTGYGWARAVIILDRQTGTRHALVTNDKQRPAAELVRLLLLRWGQENFFKRMRAEKHLDYSPGYSFAPATPTPQVANPQLKVLRAQKNALQAEIARCQGALGSRLLRRKRDTISLDTYKEQQAQLVRRLASLERELQRLSAELKARPKQVPLSQTLTAPLEQCNFERKRFLDELKLVAYHVEEQLLAIVTQHYTGKDRRAVLHQILHRGATLQLVDETLYVRLKPFDRPAVQRAAEALCAALNAKSPHTLDKFRFRVVYAVQPSV